MPKSAILHQRQGANTVASVSGGRWSYYEGSILAVVEELFGGFSVDVSVEFLGDDVVIWNKKMRKRY